MATSQVIFIQDNTIEPTNSIAINIKEEHIDFQKNEIYESYKFQLSNST